ncbi:MAG: type II toxin-antitoxin system death-on-curing family toxin [Dehalococcoidia bacterium]
MAYRFLSADEIVGIHRDIADRTGEGDVPLLSAEKLESAAARPALAAHYENADVVRQAALLTIGLMQAHPFLDGNKRVAFAAGDTFLVLNGFRLIGDPLGFAKEIVAVASRSGSQDEAFDRFETWLRRHVRFDG